MQKNFRLAFTANYRRLSPIVSNYFQFSLLWLSKLFIYNPNLTNIEYVSDTLSNLMIKRFQPFTHSFPAYTVFRCKLLNSFCPQYTHTVFLSYGFSDFITFCHASLISSKLTISCFLLSGLSHLKIVTLSAIRHISGGAKLKP